MPEPTRYAFALVTLDKDHMPTIDHVLPLWPHQEAKFASEVAEYYERQLVSRTETLKRVKDMGIADIVNRQQEIVDNTAARLITMLNASVDRAQANAELDKCLALTPEEQRLCDAIFSNDTGDSNDEGDTDAA